MTRCLKTSCSIVVFMGPGLCLPCPERRTRRPHTTEGGLLPAPGEGQLAFRLGLQTDDKTSGDILTYKSRLTPPTPHVHRCHRYAHPETAQVPTVHTYTYNRERTIQHGVPAQ